MYSDRDPVLCMYTGAVHVVVHVQGLRTPLYPGCGMPSVVSSGMGVSTGGWFLRRIGISIIHGALCLVREIQTIIQTLLLPRFVFFLYFPYKTKLGIYYIHMKQIYGLYRSLHYSNIIVYETDLWVVEVIALQ